MATEIKAMVFDVQRSSFVDGPGIRTAVFLKGCNLRCRWCHNPESINPRPEIMNGKDGPRLCGKEVPVSELLRTIERDKAFYENSGGGATFSGGEPMLQIDALLALLKGCRNRGIGTAVDTAGCVAWERFERILPCTDFILYDVKAYSSELHKEWTGVGSETILDNLSRLAKVARDKLLVRVPLIPGVNDSDAELRAIGAFLRKVGIGKADVLPYHSFGEYKYAELGRKCEHFAVPSASAVARAKGIIDGAAG